MSIDVPTELLTASSGSVGDLVFTRNQHGPYTRARTAPSDPASALQLAVRAALSQCVTAWNATLTQPERAGWDAYALALRTRTPLGRSTNAGGLGMYIRANVPRIQAAVGASPRVDQAPALLTSAAFTPITRIVLNIVDDTIHPFFTESDAWVTETGAAMLFYASAPQPLTRNFWAGPYRFAGDLAGSDPNLSTPGTLSLPVPAGPDQRVFVRGRLTRGDARLSHAFRLPADIVPQVPPVPVLATIRLTVPLQATITIDFDSPIKPGLQLLASWGARFNGVIWAPTTVAVVDNAIFLDVIAAGATSRPDAIRYAPPPFLVHGLLTGLQVVAFTFPLTA